MNRQERTSISGKHHPENHKGEGSTPCVSQLSYIQFNGTRFSRPFDSPPPCLIRP